MRGVAAFMVALSHTMAGIKLLDPSDRAIKSVIGVFANGAAGVCIFFVLSGYVLGLSLAKSPQPLREWPAFVWRRVLRIYPAMVVSLLFCWVIVNFFFDLNARYPASEVVVWNRPASWKDFLLHLVFLDNYLNFVVWTLQVEMVGSLLFPLLFFIKSRSRAAGLLLLLGWTAFFVLTPLYSYWRTGFVFMFIAGMYAADLDAWMQQRFSKAWQRPLVAGVAFAACCANTFILGDASAWTWVMYAATACVLVAALAGIGREQHIQVLDWRVTRWLGRISYSFYLWHTPVLIVVGSVVLRNIDNDRLLAHPIAWDFMLLAVTVPLAAAVAHVSYLLFEKPFKGNARVVRAGATSTASALPLPAP